MSLHAPSSRLHWVWLALLVGLGTWLRIRNLDALGLIVDEGNQALAVRAVLDTGLPRLETGVAYVRNLLLLALQCATAAVWGLDEFSLRLPSVLFGAGSILATYALASAVFDRRVALVAAAMMALSAWSIELSRYARFYTAFQCLYTFSLVLFYRGFMRGDVRCRVGFAACAIVTLAVHEFAVLLATCFMLPLVSMRYSARQKAGFLAGSGIVAVLWMLYRRGQVALETALLLPGVQPAIDTLAPATKTRLLFGIPRLRLPEPTHLLELARDEPWWLVIAASVPVLVTVDVLVGAWRAREPWRASLAVPMIGAGLAHTFGVTALLWVAYVTFFTRSLRDLWDPALRGVYASVLWCLVFWTGWLSSSAGLSARELALATFGYPAVIEYLGYWMVTGWPLLTLVVVGASIRLWSRFLPERSDASSLFIVGAVVAPTVLSALAISYHESRYVFHLYPVMLALAAWAMVWIATRALRELRTGTPFRRCVAALALAAVALVFMEDGHPGAAWGIGVRTYSDERDRARSPISWSAYAHFHQDLKSPSLHVRENRSPEDRVIAMAPPHTVAVYHFYIGGVDYVLGRPRDRSYYRRIGDRLVGWVTGSEVIEDAAAVEALRSEIHGTVWLLADWPLLDEGNGYYPESVRAYARGLGREPDYVGLDGQTFVVKLQPRDAAGRGRSEAAP